MSESSEPASCTSCGGDYRDDEDGWAAVVHQGLVEGLLCPRCQTTEQAMQAAVNDAMVEYGFDEQGRMVKRPKSG